MQKLKVKPNGPEPMINPQLCSNSIKYEDLEYIAAKQYYRKISKQVAKYQENLMGLRKIFGDTFMENLYRFNMGSCAAALGAAFVYPIDLVKTRMQAQRKVYRKYRNSFHCAYMVWKLEGISGLYRGVLTQIVLVAPENAVKLSANDMLRDTFWRNKDISPYLEAAIGGSAGALQALLTNPIEMTKIRFQTVGEVIGPKKVTYFSILRQLGVLGLYTGVQAFLLKEITFSAIYFGAYAYLKKQFADGEGYNTPFSVFCAGGLAGLPATILVTPFDVIKTRMQIAPTKGVLPVKGLTEAATRIFAEEGIQGFYKGLFTRVLKVTPQFGVTLFAYEFLLKYIHSDPKKILRDVLEVEEKEMPVHPHHIGGYSVAKITFSAIEKKFGLCFKGNRLISDDDPNVQGRGNRY